MPLDASGLEILSPEQCMDLLREHPAHLGRVGISIDRGVVVLPVNYQVDNDSVVFRTGPGTKLAATVEGRPVAFEVDAVDQRWREGWSVLIRGLSVQVTDPDELDRLRGLHLRPWAGGDKSHYVKIVASEVTGRRIR